MSFKEKCRKNYEGERSILSFRRLPPEFARLANTARLDHLVVIFFFFFPERDEVERLDGANQLLLLVFIYIYIYNYLSGETHR